MKIMHIAVVLQTAHMMVFMAHLKCIVSHYSNLNVITFILTKFF